MKTSFDAILVTAGGWVGGSIKDDDYASKLKLMQEVNLYPSLLAGHLATRYLTRGGLLVFTGAASVYKEPQPDMIAYALAKAGASVLPECQHQRFAIQKDLSMHGTSHSTCHANSTSADEKMRRMELAQSCWAG